MSSVGTWNVPSTTWQSSNVIDNVTYGDPNSCECCAGTSGNEPPWLQIDLGRNYRISLITIYGRTDGSHEEQYKNLNIFISNSSMETVNGSPVFSGNPNNGLYTYILPFKPPISFRYLLIRRFNISVMTICEVKYIEANLNLCDRLRPTAITSQSSIFANSNDYQSSNAIDGKDSYDIDHCRCCSVTKYTYSPPSWWQIDLRNTYTVDKVEIFGRQSGNKEQLEHAKLYAGNTSMDTDSNSGQLLYTVPAITDSSHFVHYIQPPITAQFFIIKLESNILTLCEFKLFEKEKTCDVGSFGAACSLKCHCADRKICNSLTGVCQTPGCLPGWTGQACDRKCHVGTYGNGCARRCNCLNDTKCDSVTGHCYIGECKPGWQGDSCDQVCDERKFGEGCNTTCNCFNSTLCDPVYGTCHVQECDPGWYGPSCSDPCVTPAFGFQCNETCHCMNGSKCNHISGYCELSQCDPGWRGDACNYECGPSRFGENCSHICHCKNNATCDKQSGVCPDVCDSKWKGTACDKDKNILGTRKEPVKTSMSTTAHNWTSDLAIDGDVGPDPDVCHCCSGTQNSQTSWWMVDMGKRFPVSHITVYSRNNEQLYQRLTGFQLYLANGTDLHSFVLIRNSTERILNNRHDVTFPSTVTRYVKIQRPGILTLCEVLVYEGDCQVGTFGDECSQICHCADERSCDAITGQCRSPACKTGWIGLACNKQCPQDTFGDKCTEMCFCAEGTCTNNYGICHGKCRHGYTGPHCNEADIINKRNETDVHTSSEHKTTTEIGPNVHTSNEHKTTTEIGTDVHTSSEHSTASVTGGAIGGTVAVLVVIVAISVIVFRMRKRKGNDSKTDYTTPDITPAQIEGEYDTLDNLNDNQGRINSTYENERITAF